MVGEIAALSTAACWAIAARMFQVLGRSFSPLALNFWKGLVSIVLLWVVTTFYVPVPELPASAYYWLVFSGIIGIGLGDTFFFQALNRIGDNQSILVTETLAPIFTALLAMAWINEWLSWQQWIGVALVLISVDFIIKIQKKNDRTLYSPSGYVYAALAALCQAVGAVVSRDILTSYEQLDPLNASQIRLWGGMAIIIGLMFVARQQWLPKGNDQAKIWKLFALATLLGTVAALYLQMLAFQNAKAAIVQTIFATSVVLSLLVALVMGEKVNKKTAIWSMLALAGVVFLVGAEKLSA